MSAVFRREFRSLLYSITGILFLGGFLFVSGLVILLNNLNDGYPGLEANLPVLLCAAACLIPLIAADAFPEENRNGTARLLHILPLTGRDILFGKLLARLAFMAIPSGILLICPLLLDLFGDVNYPLAYSALFVFFLVEIAFLTLCLTVSLLSHSRGEAYGVCYGLLALWVISGMAAPLVPDMPWVSLIGFLVLSVLVGAFVWLVLRRWIPAVVTASVCSIASVVLYFPMKEHFGGLFEKFLTGFSIYSRLEGLIYGILDMRTLLMLLCLIVGLLLLMDRVAKKIFGGAA